MKTTEQKAIAELYEALECLHIHSIEFHRPGCIPTACTCGTTEAHDFATDMLVKYHDLNQKLEDGDSEKIEPTTTAS